MALCVSIGCEGLFYNENLGGIRALLAVEFEAADGVHYGNFDIEFGRFSAGGLIHGWAYETNSGIGIETSLVPEPSSIILSGLEIICLAFRRKR